MFKVLTYCTEELREFCSQVSKCIFKCIEFIQEFLVLNQAFLTDAAFGCLLLIIHFAIVCFDRLFEIVNVDELNVELIVEMFYVL